jgi:hypothetical protein
MIRSRREMSPLMDKYTPIAPSQKVMNGGYKNHDRKKSKLEPRQNPSMNMARMSSAEHLRNTMDVAYSDMRRLRKHRRPDRQFRLLIAESLGRGH